MAIEDLRTLIAQNNALLDTPTSTIERVLARQAVLLEGVELAFLAKAAQARNPGHASIYARTALASHHALMATLGARPDRKRLRASGAAQAGVCATACERTRDLPCVPSLLPSKPSLPS